MKSKTVLNLKKNLQVNFFIIMLMLSVFASSVGNDSEIDSGAEVIQNPDTSAQITNISPEPTESENDSLVKIQSTEENLQTLTDNETEEEYYYIELNETNEDLFVIISEDYSSYNSTNITNSTDPQINSTADPNLTKSEEEITFTLTRISQNLILANSENLILNLNSSISDGVLANINIKDASDTKVKEQLGITQFPYLYSVNLSNLPGGKYQIIANLVNTSTNEVIKSAGANFSIAKINFELTNTSRNEIKAIVNVSSGEAMYSLYLDYGNGNGNYTFLGCNYTNFNQIFKYQYSDDGNYEVKLHVFLTTRGEFTFSKKIKIEELSDEDEENPDISLIYPAKDEKIGDDSLVFRFNVTDNVYVQNCTLNLYNETLGGYVKMNGSSTTVKNVGKSKEYNISYSDFDAGEYIWEVECTDNSSNSEDVQRYFSINISSVTLTSENENYEKKSDVESIISGLNDFLEKESGYGQSEQAALDSLGITSEMEFYKRRILQIQQDLKEDFKYVSDESVKAKTKSDMLTELEEMKKNVVLGISITGEKNYVKTSTDLNFEEFVKYYIEKNNLNMKNSAQKNLIKYNQEIQSNINVETAIKNVKITYLDRTEEVTLVVKTVTNKAGDSALLEVFSEDISSDAVFKTEGTINGRYFEFSSGDLVNDQLVYYFEGIKSFDELEGTETILFEENVPAKVSGMTGFSVFDIGAGNGVYYGLFGILAIIFIFMLIFVYRRIKVSRWKEEPNVLRMFDFLNQSKSFIRYKDLENAREKYHKIKEIYPLLPEDSKKFFFIKIKEVQVEIDRIDIFNLVKEYEQAKREFRKEDGTRLYQEIQGVYKRLPKKYREAVYKRVFKI